MEVVVSVCGPEGRVERNSVWVSKIGVTWSSPSETSTNLLPGMLERCISTVAQLLQRGRDGLVIHGGCVVVAKKGELTGELDVFDDLCLHSTLLGKSMWGSR